LRTALGVRPATDDDFTAVESWLREHVVPWDHNLRHLQDAVLGWYRSRHIEPPTEGRMERLVRSAVRMHEDEICAGTAVKLLPRTRKAMDALIDSSLPSDEHDAQEGANWQTSTKFLLRIWLAKPTLCGDITPPSGEPATNARFRRMRPDPQNSVLVTARFYWPEAHFPEVYYPSI
jgi:hypothetical protein